MARKPELGKYMLWQLFHRNNKIRKYLPPTDRYSQNKLAEYLRLYHTVYVKPSGGSMGRGIMKVWMENGRYVMKHTTQQRQEFRAFGALCKRIDQHRGGKYYIVQKGLQLAKVNGRPFDIRVMVQRERPGGPWLYSGMVAKIAGKGSVVTNVALSRGSVMEVPQALMKGLNCKKARAQAICRQLQDLSHTAANHFDTYQRYREIGFDIAVEQNGRIWLIEENTGPSHPLFAKLKSKLEYHRTIQRRWGLFERARKRNRA